MLSNDALLEVFDGRNVFGPMTFAQLREVVAAGRLPPHIYGRAPGGQQWLPLSQYLTTPAPPPVAHRPSPPQAPSHVQHFWGGQPAHQPFHPQPAPWPPASAVPPQPQAAHGQQGWAPAHQQPASAVPRPPPAPPAPAPPPAASTPHGAAAPQQAVAAMQDQLRSLERQLEAKQRELQSVEEAIDIQSFGFYRPRYGFESSEAYVARLAGIRDQQKLLIKMGGASSCEAQWTVDGSAKKGKKLVEEQAKLMLRAFQGESDAAIAKVKYDNVVALEQRIVKSYEQINKLGQAKRLSITQAYFDLKVAELHLVHEHREKVHEEKEEQKRIKEEMREEQRAEEEIARAKAEAEKQEAQAAAALEKARADLAAAAATSKQHEKLEALVTRLETELKGALEQKAKAIARAQLTRSGHVYVLSNIGSFGEGVYKLGLTRRLDPYERVYELGDASVPFPFDVHAIIYSEDAPALEAKLHQVFASRRVNLANHRKEYFRVTLDEIRVEVEKLHGLVTFQLDAEAEEYRKTLAARADANGEAGAGIAHAGA